MIRSQIVKCEIAKLKDDELTVAELKDMAMDFIMDNEASEGHYTCIGCDGRETWNFNIRGNY